MKAKPKVITRGQYAQLLGLQTLAVMHNRFLKDIEQVALEITGEDTDLGHTSDWLYESRSLKDLFKLLNLTLEPARKRA